MSNEYTHTIRVIESAFETLFVYDCHPTVEVTTEEFERQHSDGVQGIWVPGVPGLLCIGSSNR